MSSVSLSSINIPLPDTSSGILVTVIVFVFVTALVSHITKSKQSWIPGLVIGLIAGTVVSASGLTV